MTSDTEYITLITILYLVVFRQNLNYMKAKNSISNIIILMIIFRSFCVQEFAFNHERFVAQTVANRITHNYL